MTTTRNVTVEQLTALVEFLERHPQLVLLHLMRTKEGREEARRLWTECASMLNNMGPDGCVKSVDHWRAYFNEYKCKMFKKIKASKSQSVSTGVPRRPLLTPLQLRILTILRKDVSNDTKHKFDDSDRSFCEPVCEIDEDLPLQEDIEAYQLSTELEDSIDNSVNVKDEIDHVRPDSSCRSENDESDTKSEIDKRLDPMSLQNLRHKKLQLEVRKLELEVWEKERQLKVEHSPLTKDVKPTSGIILSVPSVKQEYDLFSGF